MWESKDSKSGVKDLNSARSNTNNIGNDSTEAMHPKHTVLSVVYDMGDEKFRGEGRTITLEFEKFYLVCCYVPNSGDGLHRLDYRINEW